MCQPWGFQCFIRSIESPEEDLFLLPFHNQSREAELIILGHVLDEKLIWEGSVGAPLDNYTVSVEKVLKGIYNGNTIGVITESKQVTIRQNSSKMKKLFFFCTRNRCLVIYLYNQATFTPS